MQLKALINNWAKAAAVSPQLMLQCYMFENLVERVSRSRWRAPSSGEVPVDLTAEVVEFVYVKRPKRRWRFACRRCGQPVKKKACQD